MESLISIYALSRIFLVTCIIYLFLFFQILCLEAVLYTNVPHKPAALTSAVKGSTDTLTPNCIYTPCFPNETTANLPRNVFP